MSSERRERCEAERERASRGFTLIELAVVVAIAAVIAALGITAMRGARIRAQLGTNALEVQTTLQTARQKALATGRDVVVIFYPRQVTWGGGQGRVFTLLDGDGGFADGTGATNLCNFRSDRPGPGPVGTKNEILGEIDLPRGISIGPPIAATGVLFPFTTVPSAATGCSFCDAGLNSGAVRFDSRGQATFYRTCGNPLPNPPNSGGSVALNSVAFVGDVIREIRGSSVIMVLPNGLVRSFHGG